jgi:hypothetical protein
MRRLLQLTVVLVACDKVPSVPAGTEPHRFAVSLDVWSGSELTITSPGLSAATVLPPVWLDGSPIPTRRVDDTTLAAALPDAPGAHSVRLVATGFDQRSVTVYLRGFTGHVEGPQLSGRTEPGRDPRYVFGSGPLSLRRWNVATNKTVDLGDSVHAVSCTSGIGPGPNVGEIVVLTGGCAAQGGRWTVWHTEPLYPLADTANVLTEHVVAVLATGRSVVLGGDAIAVIACGVGGCTSDSVRGTQGRDVVRSPRGDRAALLTRVVGDPGTPGTPVVDVSTGMVAYRVSSLREARGAAFSGGGDTLYLAGAQHASPTFALAVVRAEDGAPLTSRTLDFEPCAVAVDPAGRWVYAAGLGGGAAGRSRLVVFDRASLTVIATLGVTSSAAFGHPERLCHLIPNSIGHLLYVVDTGAGEHDPAARAQLFSFETPR